MGFLGFQFFCKNEWEQEGKDLWGCSNDSTENRSRMWKIGTSELLVLWLSGTGPFVRPSVTDWGQQLVRSTGREEENEAWVSMHSHAQPDWLLGSLEKFGGSISHSESLRSVHCSLLALFHYLFPATVLRAGVAVSVSRWTDWGCRAPETTKGLRLATLDTLSLTSPGRALPTPHVSCPDGTHPPMSRNGTRWGQHSCSWVALSGLGCFGSVPSRRILLLQDFPFILAFLRLLLPLSFFLEAES